MECINIIITYAKRQGHQRRAPCWLLVYQQQYQTKYLGVKLLEELDSNLSKAERSSDLSGKRIKAIIGPHAGYRYSGPVAAWCYKYLNSSPNQKLRVFLLGPSHYKYLDSVSFSNCSEL
jgi:AmmeMemoRadiSam system protein B